jgi:hypothetical protein
MESIGEKPIEIELLNIKHQEFRKLAMDQFFERVMGDPSLYVGKVEVGLFGHGHIFLSQKFPRFGQTFNNPTRAHLQNFVQDSWTVYMSN